MNLTGEDIQRLIGECDPRMPNPDFFNELAEKINEQIKKTCQTTGQKLEQ